VARFQLPLCLFLVNTHYGTHIMVQSSNLFIFSWSFQWSGTLNDCGQSEITRFVDLDSSCRVFQILWGWVYNTKICSALETSIGHVCNYCTLYIVLCILCLTIVILEKWDYCGSLFFFLASWGAIENMVTPPNDNFFCSERSVILINQFRGVFLFFCSVNLHTSRKKLEFW